MAGLTISRARLPAKSETKSAASDAERDGDEERDDRDLQRPGEQRQDVVLGDVADGLPQEGPRRRCGAKSAPGVTSRWTSALVRTGSASLPTKTRMSSTEAIETSATRDDGRLGDALPPAHPPPERPRRRVHARSHALHPLSRRRRHTPSALLRQRVVADVGDRLLALRPRHPREELLHGRRRVARRVEVEEAAERVRPVLRGLRATGRSPASCRPSSRGARGSLRRTRCRRSRCRTRRPSRRSRRPTSLRGSAWRRRSRSRRGRAP